MDKEIVLSLGNQQVQIDAGELVGYAVAGHEFIHQKGSPGWRNADTEMFPIIGPTDAANFRVTTPKGKAVQDQHGLLRELDYECLEQTSKKAVLKKRYTANSVVKNAKFPHKSNEAELSWPYNFEFTKTFLLSDQGLQISFTVHGEEGMPFMLGYHPAFKLRTTEASIETGSKNWTITKVMSVGSRALHVPNCERILLKDEKSLEIRTKGFGNFMLWTEVPNMVCIEPITFYPYAVAQEKLHQGFTVFNGKAKEYSVFLHPLKN